MNYCQDCQDAIAVGRTWCDNCLDAGDDEDYQPPEYWGGETPFPGYSEMQ